MLFRRSSSISSLNCTPSVRQAFVAVSLFVSAFGLNARTTESPNTNFSDIASVVSQSVVLIQTNYTTRMLMSGVSNVVVNSGIGFIISENGLGVAPQHVFRPWLYDRKLLALIDLGFIELVAGSARISAWSAENETHDCGIATTVNRHEFLQASDMFEHELLVLFVEEPTTKVALLESNFGNASIAEAISDITDIVVFQLNSCDGSFRPLLLSIEEITPREKVIVVGSARPKDKNVPFNHSFQVGKTHRESEGIVDIDVSLIPGTSGSPVVDSSGAVIGMVIAAISGVRGIAISSNVIRQLRSLSEQRVKFQERRLDTEGCEPGEIDGVIDEALWRSLSNPDCNYYQNQ